jgi:predicted lipoprotein with Yx(FWY)xxD motif
MESKKRVGVVFALLVAGLMCATGSVVIAQGAGAGQMPAGVQTAKLANGTMILADAKGMTLYTFQKDADGKSACTGQCAKNWPPLAAAADAKPMGAWTIVMRDDGTRQWAYKGMPLYGWIKDSKPGDTTGDGVGSGAWRTAVP